MKDLRLYSYWRSSCSFRVRIGLAAKGLEYETIPVNLLGDYLTSSFGDTNPMRQVPVLEWQDAGGVRRLTQSIAILELLDERFPEPSLLPGDSFARARVRQVAESVNAGIQPFQNTSVLKYVAERGLPKKEWATHFMARGLAALETLVTETAGTFAVGDQVTVADACLIPQLYNARRFGMDLDAYPTLVRVETACAVLPAFQAAHPDRQPDAPPTEMRTP